MKIGPVFYIVVFTMPTRPIKFTRYCLTLWFQSSPGLNVVLFAVNNMWTSEITVKLTSDLYVLVHHRRHRSRFSRLMSVFVQQHDCRLLDHGAFSGSLFGNWMSKVCNKLLCDLGQWAKSEALYKHCEIALIMSCDLLWMTTTWQSLPSTSFPLPFF